MAELTSQSPWVPAEPVVDCLHGVEVVDPYRWLEDSRSQRTRNWLGQQDAHLRSYLAALPSRNRVRKRVEELLTVDTISEPWEVGSRHFYLKRAAAAQQAAIMMSEGETGEEVQLVDPSTVTGAVTYLNILGISRDGSLLAYAQRVCGVDSYEVHFVDTAKRSLLPDHLPQGFCRGLIFSADCSGFYYSHEPMVDNSDGHAAIRWHRIGSLLSQDKEIFAAGRYSDLRLALLSSPSGRLLGYYKRFRTDPTRVDFLVQSNGDNDSVITLFDRFEGYLIPFLLEDALIALTDFKAPNRRIVRMDLRQSHPENWVDVVAESDSRIESIALVGQSIVVTRVKNLSTTVEILSLSGEKIGAVLPPEDGTISVFPGPREGDTVFCSFSSFSHPPCILNTSMSNGGTRIWARSLPNNDPSAVVVDKVLYPSRDGTPIPMFLVCLKESKRAGALPTFLTGYGGFGHSVTPQFTAFATYLLERGCRFAIANLRGGSEYGEAWHAAAKRRKRQVAIDDFLDGAEWLLAQDYAQPGKLAIGGGSNAGLLVAAALTQKPELFRAVVCLGPLLDMIRYHLFDSADRWIDEYGTSANESDFPALLGYSPYHAVKDGVAYPGVLLISGDSDTRCNPMHARKMTARLQAANASDHPILLDYKPGWGHTPTQPLANRIQALTDRLAFVCEELGIEA
jgi:prolyl oligopeptidase